MINKSPQITITRGNKMINVDDTPRTVYQDIEKKRDITVSVVRRTTEDRVDEIKREESKNDIRISNIPDGYVRDIKNGRVVGYTSLDGGEYIPLEAYEKIKERNAKTEELKKKAIATQSIKPSSTVPKTPIEVIRAESDKYNSDDNGDILDKITGKKTPEIVTDTVSYRESVMIKEVKGEELVEDVKEGSQLEEEEDISTEFDVEAIMKKIANNSIPDEDDEKEESFNTEIPDSIEEEKEDTSNDNKELEDSDNYTKEESSDENHYQAETDSIDETQTQLDEKKEEKKDPIPAPTFARARGGKMSLSDIMSNY